MRNDHVQRIIDLYQRGARIYMRRTNAGGKVKIRTGPFGIVTKRFDLDLKSFEEIKRHIATA